MKATQLIAIRPGTRALRIERVPMVEKSCGLCYGIIRASEGVWRVWINANLDFTEGTYLALHDTGKMERVVINPDGTEDVFLVKPEDKT